ncbi:hypothetical protein [Rheinheimera tangshanensis]|uniref:Uncharacterized protein n=1 Tax=Rheinheimera tangshanensis TaxID=400153 RepID=A0A5C8LR79_9GAMM|nr:hypothetical protein [Rheinheimera tangshanensis]MBP8227331.1 hypothetical protein [Rheinheimera sp.]TXK77700.1 hypothetical protein FU839_18050 [Rheinheimera tangshanensis]GGM70287.1 hypothetical protein GCM10010920_33910 [Rheinheimera tangshanensis]
MLNEIVLFVAKLMLLALLLINLVYLLLPSKAISQENKLEYRIEHSLLAITGAIGLAVLQFI